MNKTENTTNQQRRLRLIESSLREAATSLERQAKELRAAADSLLSDKRVESIFDTTFTDLVSEVTFAALDNRNVTGFLRHAQLQAARLDVLIETGGDEL